MARKYTNGLENAVHISVQYFWQQFLVIFCVAADQKPSMIAQFRAHLAPKGPQNRKVHTWAPFQSDLRNFVLVQYFREIPKFWYFQFGLVVYWHTVFW